MLLSAMDSFSQEAEVSEDSIYESILAEQLKALHLQGEKTVKFKELSAFYAKKFVAIKNEDITFWHKVSALRDVRDDKNSKMKTLLSEDQFEQYKILQEKNKKKLRAYFFKNE